MKWPSQIKGFLLLFWSLFWLIQPLKFDLESGYFNYFNTFFQTMFYFNLNIYHEILFLLFFFVSLGPHLRHMEIPRLGIKSELQLLAYTTATARPDPSCVCKLTKSHALNIVQFLHAAWNPLHSIRIHFTTLHVLHCFNHAAWNPLHSIGMLSAMLHKIHCIQSCCIISAP